MAENSWLEVSLTVDGEMAEAVADVLARFAPNGVAIESTTVTARLDDSDGHAVGPLRVAAYLRMNDKVEETRRRLEEALWYLGRIRPLPPVQFQVVQEADWAEAWKQHYHPIPIGKKMIIVPAWEEAPDHERVAVRIDPGMAFGTGTHPTTQLCLEFVEEAFESGSAPAQVIDIGCGSGILAIAALKLGAKKGLGVDIDLDSVKATNENARLNGVSERLEVGLGSVAEINQGEFSLQKAGLVLANILAPVLERLLDEGLGELLAPGGMLVLSGIIAEQADGVIAAAGRNGLRLKDRKQDGDWVALAVIRA
jgi:ribosomal protein L11 methyltransferase